MKIINTKEEALYIKKMINVLIILNSNGSHCINKDYYNDYTLDELRECLEDEKRYYNNKIKVLQDLLDIEL